MTRTVHRLATATLATAPDRDALVAALVGPGH